MLSIEEIAWRYICQMLPSVQGQGGSAAYFRVAVVLVRGFNLPDDVALRLLVRWNEQFAQPLWTEPESRHKLKDARDKGQMPFGHLLREDGDSQRRQYYTPPPLKPQTPPRDRAAERAAHTLTPMSDDELMKVVNLRGFSLDICRVLRRKGMLCNFVERGQRYWCITEERFAQARRYDGADMQTSKGPAKSKTLWGSEGQFVGRTYLQRGNPPVLLVEGVVGLLEAASVIDLANAPWVPLAAVAWWSSFLKDPDTLKLLRGRRVRILPDEGDPGMKGAAIWLAELESVGAHVDVVNLPEVNNDLAPILKGYERYASTLNSLFA